MVIICNRCLHSGFHLLVFSSKHTGNFTRLSNSITKWQTKGLRCCKNKCSKVSSSFVVHTLPISCFYLGVKSTSKSDLPSKWQQTNQLAARTEMKVAGGLFVVCRKALTAGLALTCFPANISHFAAKLVSLLRFDLGTLFFCIGCL